MSIIHQGKTYERAEDFPPKTELVWVYDENPDGALDLTRSFLCFPDGSEYDLRSLSEVLDTPSRTPAGP